MNGRNFAVRILVEFLQSIPDFIVIDGFVQKTRTGVKLRFQVGLLLFERRIDIAVKSLRLGKLRLKLRDLAA